ncbi:MAG: hypothetical protein JWN94_3235 [Betaproteobacteria bacterium]|nr:hypothetical protein [Betaproteobacteria bacterium]
MFTSGFRALTFAALAAILPLSGAMAAELPALPAGLTAVSKPVHLPAFNLATPAGGKMRADEFKGKVLIARFWATW